MGAYTLLQDLTVATNSTSVVLNDFGTITKDDFVKVVVTINNVSGSGILLRIFPNTTAGVTGFDTNTNYHRQELGGTGSTVFAGRANENRCGTFGPSGNSNSFTYIKLSENGKFNAFTNFNFNQGTLIHNVFAYTTSSNLTFSDPITSLTFNSSVASAIGTGSRIQIYKLAAEKVADITVASNTTQVDISNLSIDKDSEYLLVSDIITPSNTGPTYFLTPNDLTTLTGYHVQRIRGDGSSASASRFNQPIIATPVANNRTMTHTHIKLSNIGAFTAQAYNIDEYGSSIVEIQNFFISSVAENITSITKLNVISSATSGITAGSRFILYKLYE